MPQSIPREKAPLHRATDALRSLGRVVFSFAIVALGVETLVCARSGEHALGPGWAVIPVIPWLPAIPWLAYLFGVILIACALGLLSRPPCESPLWCSAALPSRHPDSGGAEVCHEPRQYLPAHRGV